MSTYYFKDNETKRVAHLRLSARCTRDASVIANAGEIRVAVKVHDLEREAETTIVINLGVGPQTELAPELAAKLKKDKMLTVWVTVQNAALIPAFVEIDNGVLYRIPPAAERTADRE